MWRAFFLAVGISFTIFGAECLVVDEAVIVRPARSGSSGQFLSSSAPAVTRRVVQPPEWAPWTFLSAGIVVLLYSFTIPSRMSG